ncbi:MAG: REP element-mobilizing transposase RayT [Candidatus Azotimanducaceae bacterium]|jgi:REP element-mobilizing transposase RayT
MLTTASAAFPQPHSIRLKYTVPAIVDDTQMATPRSQLIDMEQPLHYHLVSRCVRRSWLCGKDSQSGKNYEHRKTWLEKRMFHLAQCFAVAIDAFAIMSDHFHLVVYFDPQDSYRWEDEEVADRWLSAFPPYAVAKSPEDEQEIVSVHRAILLAMPERLLHARQTLGSLSMFMKNLKQPIAHRANKEDQCAGHFFEGRFYSGALLNESAVIAAMAYVDLNPVRARIVSDIDAYQAASGGHRSKLAVSHPDRLAAAVAPLVNGIKVDRPELSISLSEYITIVSDGVRDISTEESKDKKSRWFERIATLKKRQRAFGSIIELSSWVNARGWSVLGHPMPVI